MSDELSAKPRAKPNWPNAVREEPTAPTRAGGGRATKMLAAGAWVSIRPAPATSSGTTKARYGVAGPTNAIAASATAMASWPVVTSRHIDTPRATRLPAQLAIAVALA